MYTIKVLAHDDEGRGYWTVHTERRNRNVALAEIHALRHATIERNENAVDGPFYLLLDPNGGILA